MSVYSALQTAIYNRLSGDATLASYGVNVADVTSDNRAYPLVQIGEDEFQDFSSHTFDGFDVRIRIHTWTQAHGMKTCKQIQDRIYALMHEWDPQINGQKRVSLRLTLSRANLDPDGRTIHGIDEFQLLLGG